MVNCLTAREPISGKAAEQDASSYIQRIDNHTKVQSVELGISSLLLEPCKGELNWTCGGMILNRSGDGFMTILLPGTLEGRYGSFSQEIQSFPYRAVAEAADLILRSGSLQSSLGPPPEPFRSDRDLKWTVR